MHSRWSDPQFKQVPFTDSFLDFFACNFHLYAAYKVVLNQTQLIMMMYCHKRGHQHRSLTNANHLNLHHTPNKNSPGQLPRHKHHHSHTPLVSWSEVHSAGVGFLTKNILAELGFNCSLTICLEKLLLLSLCIFGN